MQRKINQFLNLENTLSILDRLAATLDWDQSTVMPSLASDSRSEEIAYVNKLYNDILSSKEYQNLAKTLDKSKSKKIKPLIKNIIETRATEIANAKKVPGALVEDYARTTARAYKAWEDARDKNDFSIFAPYLKKIIKLQRKESEYIGGHVYNNALNNYDEELTVTEVKNLLSELKEGLLDILSNVKIDTRGSKDIGIQLHLSGYDWRKFDLEKQKLIAKDLIKLIGIDDKKHYLGETIHPFQNSLSPNDKRIAMAYREDSLIFGISSALHEAGHCLYEQNISERLQNTCLAKAPSMSFHESQSRLYEVFIGQSKGFWKFYYPRLKSYFSDAKQGYFDLIPLDDIYNEINRVQPSLIRIEADELTYCLHIIIRFELELDMLEGRLKVDNLPKEWNKKYKKYLGITPTNMKNGVLQDMHWTSGCGYFPGYAIGNMLAAMFYNKLNDDLNLSSINENKLQKVNHWLCEKLHKHGALYTFSDTIKRIFKQELTPKPYLDYLKNKYV